ncbi:hypothetical protein PMAYCL1PPCAC_19842, partial [Pristionchus mayeri]
LCHSERSQVDEFVRSTGPTIPLCDRLHFRQPHFDGERIEVTMFFLDGHAQLFRLRLRLRHPSIKWAFRRPIGLAFKVSKSIN